MAYLLLLFVTFIWAGNFPAAKYALAVVDPLILIALRTFVGALLLLVLGRTQLLIGEPPCAKILGARSFSR